jgi:4-hydroxy-tetrahydrodipicolinate synthase
LVRLHGVYTDLVTPFSGHHIDEGALADLIERQLAAGVSGLVVGSGSAGEGMTLRPDEKAALLKVAVRVTGGRARVISGASSNATAEGAELARRAESAGVDAIIVTTPWYNKPSQDGVLRHFEHIAGAVACPIIVGDSPSRSRLHLEMATLARLNKLSTLIGIADGSGDMGRATAIRRACPNWSLLSHHELSASGCMAHGAIGEVSLTANVAPRLIVALHQANIASERSIAEGLQGRLFDLQAVLTSDPTPAAAKRALAHLGYCEPDVRLPMVTWQDEERLLAVLLQNLDIR